MATPLEFATQYMPLAQATGRRLGVSPDILLGQWGLETGWGKSVIPGTHNLGNIKDFSGSGVAAKDNMTGSTDKYRAFETPQAFADHYAGLIERKYPNAVGAGDDPMAYASALKTGGYAEDPDYINKIAAVTQTVRKQPGVMEKITDFFIPSAHAGTLPKDGPWTKYAKQSADGPWIKYAKASEPKGSAEDGGIVDGILQGIRDPIDAGAQMLRRAVPDGVGRAVDAFGNKLADMGLPVARSEGVEGVDQIVNASNQQYEAGRKAAGREGMDWARLGGNLIGTAPLIYATPGTAGAGLAARVGTGAAQGAGFGFLNPVVGEQAQQSFGTEKLMQGAIGGVLGGITPLVTGAIGRAISPKASQAGSAAKLLANEGVELTPGQAAGGPALWAEDKMMSVPILGDAIRGARVRGNEQLNRAVYNRVLAPIGQSTKKLGREAVDDVSNRISQAYDDVLAKVKFAPDQQFAQELQSLRQMASSLPARESAAFDNVIQREIIEPLTKGVAIDGQAFKRIEAQLGDRAQSFLKSTDAYQNDVGRALVEAQKALRSALERANPQHAKELQNVNQAFSQMVRLQQAAGSIGAADGVFTPAQLDRAVRAADKSVRKNSYARGRALMQDLSGAARDRMSSQIPNSGTADRLMLNAGALGAGVLNPAIPAGLAAASVPYLPGVNRAVTGLLTSRPQAAQSMANQLQKIPPGLLGILAGAAN